MSPIPGETKRHANLSNQNRVSQREHGRPLRLSVRLLLSFIAAIQLTGCCNFPAPTSGPRLLDQAFVCYRDRVWAQRAYNLEYGNHIRPFRDHFRRGFIEGYCAVCKGGEGYVPALPPEDYWSFEYQSPEGSECVNSWFEGYPLGAKAAKSKGVDKYHDVYISRMIDAAIQQDKTKVVLPSDVPIVASADAEYPPPPVDKSGDETQFSAPDQSAAGYEKFNHLFQDQ